MSVALTQVAVAVTDLAGSVAEWRAMLGLGRGARDPEMAAFGLDHEVLGVGEETLLEVVSPIRDDAAVARLLARLGGDCGYMLALHVRGGDHAALLDRIAELGITPTLASAFRASRVVQFHPRDLGTLLQVSFLDARWHWVEEVMPDTTGTIAEAITAVRVAVGDPGAMAATWRRLLDLPGAFPPHRVSLDHGTVEFVAATGTSGLVGMSVRAVDRSRVGERFELSGITVEFV